MEYLETVRSCSEYWLACGDFNEIMYSFEKKGVVLRCEKQMEEFQIVLEEMKLFGICFYGPWFTWERGNLPKNNFGKG